MNFIDYILNFLVGDQFCTAIAYSKFPIRKKLTIIQSAFFDEGMYGTGATLPKTPLPLLPDTDIPFLFGTPKLDYTEDGCIILYADLVASSYFLLSRYEEIIKPNCRDQYGRFRAKDSVVFQQGYGMRPLVDEWSRYLRGLLRQAGVDVPNEKQGFNKIYLTHDVDEPFRYYHWYSIPIQLLKKFLHRGEHLSFSIKSAVTGLGDPYYTFGRIIGYDNELKENCPKNIVQSVYFIIAAGSFFTRCYCNITLAKFCWMLRELRSSGAKLGLHVSYEAGENPSKIAREVKRFSTVCNTQKLYSRHHFLRWCEPEDIDFMELSGITDDFTLGYPDCIGFRCGTGRPYKFINPKTKQITDVTVHPMQIMECTLDRKNYMGLDYESAFEACKKLIDETYKYNGELNMLWHNTSFISVFYHERLYVSLLEYISRLVRLDTFV